MISEHMKLEPGKTYDISAEESRTYVYGDGDEFTIYKPMTLLVSHSGNHYITSPASEHCYIVAPGWRLIEMSGVDEFIVKDRS